MTAEDEFKAWVGSLSLLDQQMLKDHALDSKPPDKVVGLLKYSGVAFPGWFETDPPAFYYPEPLLRALGVERHAVQENE
jgi:hypothetical protein